MEGVFAGQGARGASHLLASAIPYQLPHLPDSEPARSWANSYSCTARLDAASVSQRCLVLSQREPEDHTPPSRGTL